MTEKAFGDSAKSESDGEVLFLVNRVQQKKEAPVYSEIMSPPVYSSTMPPSYPPPYYNMRSPPTYQANAGQQDGGGSGNYWVWDANNQTYAPSNYPPNNPPIPFPGSDSNWQWNGEAGNQDEQQSYDYWNYQPQSEEEQRQFWEHYGQMCAYLAQLNAAACRYSPYPVPPMPYPSDTDECGYSSNDEMTYYGQMFKQRAQNYWKDKRPQSTPNSSTSTPARTESTDKVSDDGTEEKDNSDSSDTDTDNTEKGDTNKYDESDASDDENMSSKGGSEIPHQLSVIFEESEPQSEADSKISYHQSDDEDSSATLENESRKTSADNTSSDTENSVVRVRLPLKLKFSQNNGDGQVTTVIVGDSEVESSPEVRSEEIWSPTFEKQRTSPVRTSSWNVIPSEPEDESLTTPDVTVTISLNRKKSSSPKDENNSTLPIKDKAEKSNPRESPVDFWKEMTSDEDIPKQKLISSSNLDLSSSETSVLTVKRACSGEDNTSDEEDESDSQSSDEEIEVKKCEEQTENYITNNVSNDVSSDEESNTDSSNGSTKNIRTVSSQISLKCDSVKRNIDLLMFKESIDNDKSREGDESDNDDSSDSDSSCANLSVSLDGQNEDRMVENQNERSVEESEEDDSGVTSDLSRHISETDTDAEGGSELSKMTRYQRAATHSRLFKLLQDECSEDQEDDDSSLSNKRERLTLPLAGTTSKSNISSDQESSSSGINSPMSPAVNERLVKELVQSLLSRKKGRHFRKLPLDKLYAAATRILQEDMDYDTGSTSDDSNMFLSPGDNRIHRPPGYELPNPETYGDNYHEYRDYYSSWADAAYYTTEPSYDILPSNTFRKLRHPSETDRRRDFTVPVRCPKVSLPNNDSSGSRPNTAPPET